jgi:hypothetical protein
LASPRASAYSSGAMAEHEPEVAAAVREIAEQARRDLGPHVAPDDLLAYHEALLSASERELIQDHLAVCRPCADLVLDMERFPDLRPVAPERQLSDAVVAQRWESLRERLRREGHGFEPTPAAPRPGLPRDWLALLLRFLRPLSRPLTAGLLAAGLTLALWGVMLHQRLAEHSRPAVRVYVGSLVPQGQAALRAPGSTEAIRVPPWADRILLILNVFEPRSYASYQVAIFPASGTRMALWSSQDLRRSADGSFAFEVPRGFLRAGRYRIELLGLAGSRRERLAVYDFLLEFV